MGGLPGIGSVTKQRTSQAYWDSSDIAIVNFAIDGSSGAADLRVRNNYRDTITIATITLDGTDLDTTDQTLLAGETITFTADNDFSSLCSGGDSFSVNVSMEYTDSVTGGTYTFTGDGHNLEGECAE